MTYQWASHAGPAMPIPARMMVHYLVVKVYMVKLPYFRVDNISHHCFEGDIISAAYLGFEFPDDLSIGFIYKQATTSLQHWLFQEQ